MKIKNWFIDFFKGSALGIGLLPGVSAGTIGITVGIYDKLIGGVSNLRKEFLKSLLILLPIGLGWAIAGIALLYVEHLAWDKIPFIIVLICAGFTVGGLPVIFKEVLSHKLSAKDFALMALGFVAAAGIGVLSVLAKVNHWFDVEAAFLSPNENVWIYPLTIVIGIIAMGACIIPGISGAMILFIFGLYQPVLDLYMGDNSLIHNHARVGTGLILTACLLVGIVAGLILASKLMKGVITKHHDGTFDVVIGFVLGSLIAMFVNNQIWDAYFNEATNVPWHWAVGAACFLVVGGATFYFVRKAQKRQIDAQQSEPDTVTNTEKSE